MTFSMQGSRGQRRFSLAREGSVRSRTKALAAEAVAGERDRAEKARRAADIYRERHDRAATELEYRRVHPWKSAARDMARGVCRLLSRKAVVLVLALLACACGLRRNPQDCANWQRAVARADVSGRDFHAVPQREWPEQSRIFWCYEVRELRRACGAEAARAWERRGLLHCPSRVPAGTPIAVSPAEIRQRCGDDLACPGSGKAP